MKHVLLTTLGGLALSAAAAQTGTAADHFKISNSVGNLGHTLVADGRFGYVFESTSPHGLIAAAPGEGNGAIYVMQLGEDEAQSPAERYAADDFDVFAEQTGAEFGTSVLDLGDRDGDGQPDYLIGAPGYGDGGALFVLASNDDSPVLQEVALPPTWPTDSAGTGHFLASDGDQILVTHLGGTGSIHICELDATPALTVVATLDETTPALAGKLDEGDRFGSGLSTADMNGDGHDDILCGAPGDDDQDTDFGAVYILYRDAERNVTGVQKLSRAEGDFGGFMNSGDEFGISVRCVGDLDENGSPDLIVGAPGDDDGGLDIGAVWVLFMRADGTVKDERKINRLEGNFDADINFQDRFGTRLALIGDHNGDGTVDFAAGAILDDDGATDAGALHAVLIDRCPAPSGYFDFTVNGGEVHFTAEGGDEYSHIWNFDDGGYSQEQNPTHTYESNGTYMVCLAINNDCGGDNYCRNVTVTDANTTSTEEVEADRVSIFPNPTFDRVNIRTTTPPLMVRVMDITGKEIHRRADPGPGHGLSLVDFPAGLYFVEIVFSDTRLVRKVEKR